MNIKKILKILFKGAFLGVGAFLLGIFLSFLYDQKSLLLQSPREWKTTITSGFVKDFRAKIPKAFIVYSGSMGPAIKTASVVFTQAKDYYYKGDIITFHPNGQDKTVTHRVEAVLYPDGLEGQASYKTSGDANKDFDNWEVKKENVVGKVSLIIPYLGYLANFAKTPQGFILLVIVPATIVIYEEIRTVLNEIKKLALKILKRFGNKKVKAENLGSRIPKATVLIPILGAAVVAIGITTSYFFDKEEIIQNVLSTATSFEEPSPTPTPTDTPGKPPQKVTICHVAGRSDDPANFITLTLPWNAVYGPGGHFNESGTSQAGHEQDYLGPCTP